MAENLYPGEEHWPALRPDRLLEADATRLLPLALAGAPRAGAPVVEAIERRLERHPVDPAEAHRLLAALPQSSLVLASVAVRLSQRALAGEAGMAPAERAGLLNDFSNRLCGCGGSGGGAAGDQGGGGGLPGVSAGCT